MWSAVRCGGLVFRLRRSKRNRFAKPRPESSCGRGSLTRLFGPLFLQNGHVVAFAYPPRPPNGRLGDGWIHEIKHDGFRIMARRDSAGVRLLTRRKVERELRQ
jgi:hypothetical protein